VESTYSAQVAGILPLSEDMVRLASGGVFCLREPAHQFSTTVRAIAAQI
jgi:MinD-like ATPase involved in chromosome partitioning or flagellar assembly